MSPDGKYTRVWWRCEKCGYEDQFSIRYCLAAHGPLHCQQPMVFMDQVGMKQEKLSKKKPTVADLEDRIYNLETLLTDFIAKVAKVERENRDIKAMIKPHLREG